MFLARIAALLVALMGPCLAQTPGPFIPGQPLPAGALNGALARKQDFPIPNFPSTAIPNTWTALQSFMGGATVPTLSFGTNTTGVASTAFVESAVSGLSGGGLLSVVSPSVLAVAAIPSTQTSITVLAMATSGTSTCALNFTKGTSSPTGQYQEVLNTPSGVYWEPVFDSSPVRACQFGTVADGAFNQSNNVVTGTDNTTFIQNALDYAMRNNFNTVCLNDGIYETTNTLAIGWGQSVISLSMTSCSGARSSYSTTAGVTLLPTKTDRCPINFAGSRQGALRGIQLIGQNHAFLVNLTQSIPWPTSAAGWLDPLITPTGTNPGGISRYAPYFAICIDGYHGTAQTNHYPNQTFPAWQNTACGGTCPQYGQNASSDIEIRDLFIDGFAGCLNIMSNGDGNGDFVKASNMGCTNSTYGESIGQSQARATSWTNGNCSNVYTLLTNTQFGTQNGELDGNLTNPACSLVYQMIDINPSITGVSFQDTYMEGIVKIGNVSGTGGAISFINPTFTSNTALTGLAPAAMLDVAAGGSFRFIDGQFGGSYRIQTLVHYISGGGTVEINNTRMLGGIAVGSLMGGAGAAGQNALNYTGGLLAGALTYPTSDFPNRLIWNGQSSAGFMSSPTAATVLSQTSWTKYPVVGVLSRALWSQAMEGFTDALDFKTWKFTRGPGNQTIGMTSGSWTSALTSASCDTWTGQWSVGQQNSQNGNLQLGDMFYHQATGTIWDVEVIGSPSPTNIPITLRQQNNMVTDVNGNCVTNNLGTTMPAGNSLQIHVAAAIPGQVFYCDFAAGNVNLTNCSRGDGNGTQMTSVLAAGDKFWSSTFDDTALQWPFSANASISSVTNGSPGSMVLSNVNSGTKSGRFPILPFPTDANIGEVKNTIAAKPTPSASGGTCAVAGAQTGNQVTGTVALSGACAASNTITLTFLISATATGGTAWQCGQLTDRTAPTILFPQTSQSATTAVFTAQGTSGAADVLGFHCEPY
jgi:hypothetical protein